MNPYMAAFSFMGLVYAIILVWGLVMSFGAVSAIGMGGALLCAAGWKISKEYT